MGEDETGTGRDLGRTKLVGLVLLGIAAAVAAGIGTIKLVEAVEAGPGCDPYGSGYGCGDDGTILVAPSTDLVDRQTVTITASGFAPNTSFGAAQCDATFEPGSGTDACDLSNTRLTTTDATGQAQLTFVVRRIITIQGQEVDCALSPCAIGAATIEGTTPIEAATHPLEFDPDVPAVPRLEVTLTVGEVTASSLTGTVTCNRAAELFANGYLEQDKGGHTAFAYGYIEDPGACGTEPADITLTWSEGDGAFTGGPASYAVSVYAYDGFEDADAFAEGTTSLTGTGGRVIEPSSQPGETVSVQILGTSGSGSDLTVDVLVTCDRAMTVGDLWVTVTQLVGLESVSRFGGTSLEACDGAVPLSVPITDGSGALAGGPAKATARVYVADLEGEDAPFYDSASTVTGVRLQGSGPSEQPPPPPPNPESRIEIVSASRASLSLVVTCEEPAEVDLWVELQQATGRTTAWAFGGSGGPCDGATSFTIPLEGDLGGGTADVFVYATGYREGDDGFYEYLWDDHQAGSVRLRG